MVDFKKTPMTQEQAEYVRKLRVDLGYSWRSIAGMVAVYYPKFNIKTHDNNKAFDKQPDGYQSEGMDLCTEAAFFFGECAGEKPWN